MRISLFLWAILPFVVSSAWADYVEIDLGNLGSAVGSTNASARAINNAGQIVGYANTSAFYSVGETGDWHGFIYTESTGMKDLGNTPLASPGNIPGGLSVATAISENGQIAGVTRTGWNTGFPMEVVRWNADSTAPEVITAPWYQIQVTSVNDAGDLVGTRTYYDASANPVMSAFLIDSSNNETPITVPGYSNVQARVINDNGSIIGNVGLDGYFLQNIDANPVLYSNLIFVAMNNMNQILARDPFTNSFEIINNPGTMMETITAVPALSGTYIDWVAINNHGTLVGNGGATYEWTPGGSIINLNNEITNAVFGGVSGPFRFGTLTAYDINDNGWIVGEYKLLGPRAFLLKPVPEPGTLVLASAAVGVFLLVLYKRSRRGMN